MKKFFMILAAAVIFAFGNIYSADAKYIEEASSLLMLQIMTDESSQKKELTNEVLNTLELAFNNNEYIEHIASLLVDLNDYSKASKFVNKIIKENPDSARAYELKYYLLKDYDKPVNEILETLNTANAKCPNNVKILTLLANEKYEAGDIEGAQKIKNQINQNLTLSQKGDKAIEKGNYNEALGYYKKALDSETNKQELSYKIAAIYVTKKEFSSSKPYLRDAIGYFDEQIKKYPGEPLLLVKRAQLKKLYGDMEGCNADIQKAKKAFWGDTRFIDEAINQIPSGIE